MAINFNEDSVWNLHTIKTELVRDEVNGLLIDGESIVAAFQTVRDQLVFTDKRIIAMDVQGIMGRKTFSILPYSKVQFFSIDTSGFLGVFSDTELVLEFANGFTAKFEFQGNVDIGEIGRAISKCALV